MNSRIASEIAGFVDYKLVEQADHKITAEERNFAIEIAHEMADRHGIDLDAHVAAHHARLAEEENKLKTIT